MVVLRSVFILPPLPLFRVVTFVPKRRWAGVTATMLGLIVWMACELADVLFAGSGTRGLSVELVIDAVAVFGTCAYRVAARWSITVQPALRSVTLVRGV